MRNYEANPISLLEAAVALGTIIAGKEEFVYKPPCDANESTGCIYADRDDNPSCIIGHLLAKFGIPLPKYGSWNNGDLFIRSADLYKNFTHETRNFLQFVQSFQDDENAWGSCVAMAIVEQNAGHTSRR